MTTTTDIEEFLDGPLVTWLRSCLDDPDSLSDYDDLADGVLIHQVLLLIDPEPVHLNIGPSLGNPSLRVRNMEAIVKNIKNLYEEELCQVVVALPDTVRLGREPETKEGLQEMQLLLLLLLGCAVQCPNKQTFIEQIKTLPIDAQHSLVHCIKQLTESQEIVLTTEGCETASNELLLGHIRRLVKQRDAYIQAASLQDEKKQASAVAVESQHLAVELADWKAKLRKQRQELEEKSEALAEAREELEQNRSLITKLKTEIVEVKAEARGWKAYRDEADSLREKAERCERLEAEAGRFRERLADLDYYRSRVEELREDNRVLEETREMLEAQLARATARAQYTVQLEADIMHHKQTIDQLSIEREAHQEKLQELFEENAQLTLLSKSAVMQDSAAVDEDLDESSTGDSSLCEQLSSSVQARALRLELENRRLASTVESLQDAALTQTNERVLALDKDKKRLSLKVEELEETKRKLTQHISELEASVKSAQRDTLKMQDIRDSLQSQLQSRVDEVEGLTREKERVETRARECEERLEEMRRDLEDLKCKCASMEREATRLRSSLESKAVEFDKVQTELEKTTKGRKEISSQLEEAKRQITRLTERETERREAERRWEVDRATVAALQRDLLAEKLCTQELRASLERFGLPAEHLDPDNALDRLASNPEVLRAVRERLAQEGEGGAQQARLEVDLTTLQSHISSLTSQLTALHLANSQLAAEKEELTTELEKLRREHGQLLVDQLTLQGLHETLGGEYEGLVKERESLRGGLKEARGEARGLKEEVRVLKEEAQALKAEMSSLRHDATALPALRAEHSKLKEDFRKLFTASEKLKGDYMGSQEEYRSVRTQARQMGLVVTELQGEVALRDERITSLEVQLSKLLAQCDLLKQVKMTLEEDRRSLMEHVTLLLGQYHELLTHSLEDKEHYHLEEKMFTDKLNNLYRQKEKLEEKIMEHYRRLESCPTKKKSFGANVVRKLRKAGSDFINKSRKSWHEEAGRRGTDSDTSLEDVRTRQAEPPYSDGLGLSTPGTRRTVYLSGDENSASTNDHEDTKSTVGDVPRSSTPQQQDPSVLVYNRVTAVVGGGGDGGHQQQQQQQGQGQSQGSTTPSRKNKPESEIWFEYGCI